MQVFEYIDIKELPPRARLLSSIWSYRYKRCPNGDLIKYMARKNPMLIIILAHVVL